MTTFITIVLIGVLIVGCSTTYVNSGKGQAGTIEDRDYRVHSKINAITKGIEINGTGDESLGE